MDQCQAFSENAVLDATVPNWRFTIQGAGAIRDEFSRWYADPGSFEEVLRTPIRDGELVEFTLCWEEGGIPHAVHQVHVIGIGPAASDEEREANGSSFTQSGGAGRITSDRAWCGGRWSAALLAEMALASAGE